MELSEEKYTEIWKKSLTNAKCENLDEVIDNVAELIKQHKEEIQLKDAERKAKLNFLGCLSGVKDETRITHSWNFTIGNILEAMGGWAKEQVEQYIKANEQKAPEWHDCEYEPNTKCSRQHCDTCPIYNDKEVSHET